MNFLINFLSNSWVIGIGGGLVSSAIVTFITRKILSKKEEREYLQRLETANNEILYSLRPLIIDKEVPSKKIIDSALRATAQNYEVKKSDLYNINLISDILIKEIVNNSFLSSEQKIEFTNLIHKMKKNYIDKDDDLDNDSRNKEEELRIKEVYSQSLSRLLGIISALITSIILINKGVSFNKLANNNFKEVFLLIVASTTVIVVSPRLNSILSIIEKIIFGAVKNHKDEEKNNS